MNDSANQSPFAVLQGYAGKAARVVSMLWAASWTLFGLVSGIGEGLDPISILIHTAIPGLIFLAVTAIAWKWPVAGGLLLGLIAMLTIFFFPVSAGFDTGARVLMVLTLYFPPVISAILFILSAWKPLRRWRQSFPDKDARSNG